MEIASQIGSYNKKLTKKNPYLLIGPGRWGTTDSWLGIPVNWEQISNAKAIVEIGIESLNPDPSFGSHFFQNITSLRIGYFTIEKKLQNTNIDWKWLDTQNKLYSSSSLNLDNSTLRCSKGRLTVIPGKVGSTRGTCPLD